MKSGGARLPSILAIAIGLVVASCSGGPSAETTEFCEAYVDVESLLATAPEAEPEAWVAQTIEGLEGVKSLAPEEIGDQVTRMADSLLGPIEAMDVDAFSAATESQEFVDDAAVVDTFIVDECGFHNLDITAVDYAYEADFEGLEPGMTAISFSNGGTEIHEMLLARINDDTTESAQELLELPEEEAMTKATMLGAVFGFPGEGDTLFVDLDPGRYAIFCFLPVGSTPDNLEALEAGELEGAPHFTQGMVQEFTIES